MENFRRRIENGESNFGFAILDFGEGDWLLAQFIPAPGEFINHLPAKIEDINNPIDAQTI